ncbi:NAD(P)H-binding protein [Nocardiopsis trehalosi]|uniref:NAD(P)H-binding protein n=1 Tax=Nocardiopsis trehalosi TaxID=109329 RepID=UPI000AD50DC0|nr:NAD(P)H-binding protein [Nocardiopsis trehalosi]
MTVLVTGATGNVGRRVVAGLAAAGVPVRAMARRPEAAAPPPGVRVVAGDFTRPETWAAALDGVAAVYLYPFSYLTGPAGEAFAERAAAAGVRRFVVHSAIAAGFDGTDDPADPAIGPLRRHLAEERDAHRAAELLVEATDREWTHLRPGLLAANALGWAGEVRATGAVRLPYPDAGNAVVHEADIADVAVAALTTDDHVGAVYELTGPERVTQAEQVAAIGAAIGRDLAVVAEDPDATRARWSAETGLGRDLVDGLVAVQAASVAPPGLVPPTGTVERLTGRPARSFAAWARDHAADFR